MRILVVGCPGAGKSTFATALGRDTGLPVRHLDDRYWGPGWSRPDAQWWAEHQATLTEGDQWIVDGNYLPTLHLRVPRADLVVLLDASTLTCLIRVLRRAWQIKRGARAHLPARVRAEAQSGTRVPATKAFLPLLSMILRFRRRDWWKVVDLAGSRDRTTLMVAVVPGLVGSRVPGLRRRLRNRAVSATVCPLADAGKLIRDLAGYGVTTPEHASDMQVHKCQEGNGP
ncbi:hypothetical protein [Micromonospora rubida]